MYTHRNVAHVLAELNGKNIHRAAGIPVYEFGRGFVEAIAAVVQRRAEVAISQHRGCRASHHLNDPSGS